MSREIELLQKILTAYREDKSCMSWGVANEIKELLAQPEQSNEPVAWMYDWEDISDVDGESVLLKGLVTNNISIPRMSLACNVRPLHASPPTRQPLSKEEFMKFFTDTYDSVNPITDFVRAIEKAHGIGIDNE